MPSAGHNSVHDTCIAGSRSPFGSVPSGGSGQYRSPDLVDTEEKLNAILEPCGNIIPKV